VRTLPENDLDYELWWLILHTRRSMRRIREKELFQYRITPERAGVLYAIHMIGKRVTPAEISRFLLREPHSVSNLINRMKAEGLVKKVKDLNRKNLVRVVLTDKGREAYKQTVKRDSIHKVMSHLSEEERKLLRALLEKLCENTLKELGVTRKPIFS
jgi:DNA-binding MarR family transcriptional regulator